MPEQDSACFRREPLVSRQLHRETDATTFMPVKQRPLQPCHLIQKRCPAIDFSGALATNVNNPWSQADQYKVLTAIFWRHAQHGLLKSQIPIKPNNLSS
jgi:hypothetical protein